MWKNKQEKKVKQPNNAKISRKKNWNHHPTVISIDWDFFIWNGLDAAKPAFFINKNGDKVDFFWMFDWGREYRHPDALQREWRFRKNDWDRLGLKIEGEFTIRTDRGCTSPDEFISVLHKVTTINNARVPIYGFDLHSNEFYLARELSLDCEEPIHLIHFDAHHDLGYSSYANIQKQIEEDSFEYGSWLFHAIRLGYVGSLEIVYPDWRGMIEWRNIDDKHIRDIIKKVEVYTWSKWKKKNTIYSNIGSVGVAKSTPWTPPWLDRQYLEFIFNLSPCYSSLFKTCWDCMYPDLSKGFDACHIRGWDQEG